MIPNRISVIALSISLLVAFLENHFFQGLFSAMICFVLTSLLWRLGLLGGGDAKLMTALAAALPCLTMLDFVLLTACAGGVLGLVYVVIRRVTHFQASPRPAGRLQRHLRAEIWRIHRGCPLPYTVAIAAGFLSQIAR